MKPGLSWASAFGRLAPFLALWGWPAVFAVVTVIGLVGALVGDGRWDWLGWIGLGMPTGAALWFGLRGR
jgi:hypothetical protein